MAVCKTCKKEKEASEFSKAQWPSKAHEKTCKQCRNDRRREQAALVSKRKTNY